MIRVSVDVTKDIQFDAFIITDADTKLIETKHSGKFISNLSNDGMITNLVSTIILNLFKDSLTLIGLLCDVLSKLEAVTICNNNDTNCFCCSKNLR